LLKSGDYTQNPLKCAIDHKTNKPAIAAPTIRHFNGIPGTGIMEQYPP